ncbi:MAG: molybdenum cofactor biosynthesis protein B [Gammaproteobacteria bacterium]|nr:molybdenum cofactor biosynthesis protein B [Gammaproteobacteria bacterium]
MKKEQQLTPLAIAVLTISDSRNEDNDTSGQFLVDALKSAGHKLVEKRITTDNIYRIRAAVSSWIANNKVQVVICNGGTGLTGRDGTPEAISPLLDKVIDGFGEMFRAISIEEIGTSSLQSRALAGVANGTIIFCLPGSTGACTTAWTHIISKQLDSRTRPCNLVQLIPRLIER